MSEEVQTLDGLKTPQEKGEEEEVTRVKLTLKIRYSEYSI
jgi:hypothetical protein